MPSKQPIQDSQYACISTLRHDFLRPSTSLGCSVTKKDYFLQFKFLTRKPKHFRLIGEILSMTAH